MTDTDLCFTPATQCIDALRVKRLFAVEITTAVLDRIAALEPRLNAFAQLAAEEAMEVSPPLWPTASRRGRCTACR